MGLSRTILEINGNNDRKTHIFPTSHVFYAASDGVPLEILIR